jgi:ABC-type branched-subunit amino acid transport system substrate-binding protein
MRAAVRTRRAAGATASAGATAVALALAGAFGPPAAAARAPVPADVSSADRLAAQPSSTERDRALAAWAARAPLAELMFVLRRPPAELGSGEPALVRAAYERAPRSRTALRRRLGLRWALLDPKRAGAVFEDLARDGERPPARPRASVFRIAALLPDTGSYEGYGRAVRLGLEAGLADHNARAALPLELDFRATGDDQPARAAAALDSAADRAGAVVGGLLSAPTVALATAARLLGVPLISPTATDENVGAIGPTVFQIGPAGLQRGEALARAVLDSGAARIGVLVSSRNQDDSFVRGFAAAAESLGGRIVWRDTYAPGSLGFRDAVRALKAQAVQILFWEGEAREGEVLVRQLAQERVSLRLCGGSDLDPDGHHAITKTLLEGARFVGLDWGLAPGSRAVLDSLVRVHGEPEANRLHVAGYLAARLIGSAVASGALCPEELSAALARRVGEQPYLRSRGFFAWAADEATLTIYTVRGGRAVPVAAR